MPSFLEIEPQYSSYENARFVVLPVPYESTTSYGKGTRNGPAAILKASAQVENFIPELGCEPYRKAGIHTLKSVAVARLESRVESLLKDNKIPVILGGEHSLTPIAVKAFARKYKDLSVLQLDAHADLRNSYKGRKDSHACVMRRVLEICPAVQVGVRSLSQEEYNFAQKTGQLKKTRLSKNVYITIDVDVFDPSVIPATGTPEPGGMLWQEMLTILRTVCAARNVVGFDVVELAPIKGQPASDFTVAKLVYQLIGYIATKK